MVKVAYTSVLVSVFCLATRKWAFKCVQLLYENDQIRFDVNYPKLVELPSSHLGSFCSNIAFDSLATTKKDELVKTDQSMLCV